MAQVTNFFVGANSGDGFQNLFPEMIELEDTYDFMVLKGGPGVGKNTFMREIGKAMEQAGTPVEYLWCSGDPDSLDGVVLPELKCAVADGTSPHGIAPKGHHFRTSYLNRGVTAQIEPQVSATHTRPDEQSSMAVDASHTAAPAAASAQRTSSGAAHQSTSHTESGTSAIRSPASWND